ncbi:MAG: hypothetical protein ACFCUQ_20435 [Kiloniellales bacterium]
MPEDLKRKTIAATKRALRWGDRRVPPGLRTLLGLLFMVAGVFGFLPVLGFWMLPIGAALVALDIPPLRRRLMAWQKARSGRRSRPETNSEQGGPEGD